ncbi:hypothetical protein LguiB_006610 [Lonicera macranthoides]
MPGSNFDFILSSTESGTLTCAMDVVRLRPPAGESSSSSSRHKYDVFLSFIGEQGPAKFFTNKLYAALIQAGLNTFFKEEVVDDVETRGSTEVERAIVESWVSIVVFSDHFASASNSSSSESKWCSVMEELAKILEYRGTIFEDSVLPVYYGVDPSQVHASIREALEKYEKEEFGIEKLRKAITWREALRETMELDSRVLLNPSDISESSFIQEIIKEIQHNMEDHPRPEERKQDEMWFCKEVNLVDSTLSELPEKPYCPSLEKLFLQQNSDLAAIPFSFFKNMPALQVLDLSDTSIKFLPTSISSLFMLRELFVRDCQLLMELPPEIGALSNLQVLDLEGTKLIYLPKEIRMLSNLVCMKVSLYRSSDKYRESRGIEAVIPRATLSKFYYLKELSIDVDPDCGWWDIKVEVIIEELCRLRKLQTLKLYLPKLELLQQLLQVTRGRAVKGSLSLPLVFPTLSNFRLIVGPHEQRIVSCLPMDLQVEFEKLEKCLKYVNGEGSTDAIGQVLKCTSALFLERHWSIKKLSVFKIDEMDKLKFCLLVECNEMNAVVEGADFYDQQGDKRTNRADGKPALRSLQYLGIHYMKNLECVWRGPVVSGCLSSLRVLDLHTCPNLSTIFSPLLLCNLTNLKELTLEDCPKVKSVICVDSCSYQFLLPSLEKISLLDLPELVSIFSGARIAPKLERMLVYNCPKLQTLSPMETSFMKEIKGEREWWEGLEWHKSEQRSEQDDNYLLGIFVPLKSDGDLVEELVEAENLRLNTLRMFQTYTESSESSVIQEVTNEIQLNKRPKYFMEESTRPEERKQDELWFCKEININLDPLLSSTQSLSLSSIHTREFSLAQTPEHQMPEVL